MVEFAKKATGKLKRRTRLRYNRIRFGSSKGCDVIYIDPNDIEYFLIEGDHLGSDFRKFQPQGDIHEIEKSYFHPESFIGISVPGPWDKHVKLYEFDRVYQGIKKHYCDNLSWEDTEYYHQLHFSERVNSKFDEGYADRRMSDTIKLYNSISENGYNIPDNKYDHIMVNIGRNGEFIFNNLGHHRLAICKILDVKKIPVLVVATHMELGNRNWGNKS